MSLDSQRLVSLMKQAAVEAVTARDPMSLKIGEVVAASPLEIRLDAKITVSAPQLLLTDAVRDHAAFTETDTGTLQKHLVRRALKKGEKVLMLRCDGGQKFIVLDRLEAQYD